MPEESQARGLTEELFASAEMIALTGSNFLRRKGYLQRDAYADGEVQKKINSYLPKHPYTFRRYEHETAEPTSMYPIEALTHMPYVVDPRILQAAKDYATRYGNERIVRRVLPGNEFPEGVVGFTFANPALPEFFTLDDGLMPYLNGVHSGKAVKLHEEIHIKIARYGGEQNERAINNHVAAKLGYTIFPFPSY